MNIKKNYTNRGFRIIEFEDLYHTKCNIQKSSLATDDAIWIGVQDASPKILASKTSRGGTGWIDYPLSDDILLTTRMHLSREQVRELLPILQEFVETGEINSN